MLRKLFYIFNFSLFGLFIIAVIQDWDRPWKKYQKRYYQMERERLQAQLIKVNDEEEIKSLKRQLAEVKQRPLEIKQIMIESLGRVDRCITCHVAMDEFTNPSLTNGYMENPYKGHPLELVKAHPFSKFGCTSCHAGQGLATTLQEAHGRIEHWEEPMLKTPYIEASCVKCHGDFMALKGAETAARGRKSFEQNGCIGCHSLKGWGGGISVDLGDVADKPVARIDFSNTGLDRLDWNAQNWIELHFTRDPMEIVPNDPEGHLGEPIAPSGMPPFYEELGKEEAQALTTYLMAMTARSLPKDYYVYAAAPKEPYFPSAIEHGKYVFEKYGCAGCHGIGGKKGRRNFNALGPNQEKMEDGREPTLVDTVGTFSREELRQKIQNGVSVSEIVKFKADGPVPPLYMPAWKDRIKGQELEDLISYLLSIAKKDTQEW